ncbi:unnamed protein product [Hermetia illucens]|uniref:Potassium channel domain-containing protein n=1 Tax=Hermetia illucens TaxID=343691 RepID=A0A7R8UVD8_HERIL|nr:unnamed protein product [Hermetia illucens]
MSTARCSFDMVIKYNNNAHKCLLHLVYMCASLCVCCQKSSGISKDSRLAALEIVRLQNKLVKRFAEDIASQLGHNGLSAGAVVFNPNQNVAEIQDYEWTFAQAFLYSLTVLTTIGYGNLAPKTALGKVVTLTYAILGIPLTLVYLSSTGGVLARVARGVFSRALCCCLCSNCGYCCYDEKRMAEKERRMKKKRQQEEFRAQHFIFQDPYNAQSGTVHNSLHSSDKQIAAGDADSLSSLDSNVSMHGLSLLAPIILCVSIMGIYISLGAIALYRLEGWCFLDGVYFCFMSLSTIGFGDVVPSLVRKESSTIVWFCSLYIMLGMALTAMCFNVVHQEIVHRIQHYERTANLYQQNPTEDTLIRGTTTSCRGLFPDVNQLHIPRGSVTHNLNYNLTPVASMEPNNSSNPPCIPTVLLPEVLDDVSQMFQLAPVKESQPSNFIIDQKLIQQAIVVQSVLTGVYTLSEEPELEGDNTQLKGDSP